MLKRMSLRTWVVCGVAAAACAAAAGCSQGDVGKADTAFHQVAEGTHGAIQDADKGAQHVGHEVREKVNDGKKS